MAFPCFCVSIAAVGAIALGGGRYKAVCRVIFHKTTRQEMGLVGEVRDWQGVTTFEESAQNYFGRILLLRSDAARPEVGERGGAALGV